jgi:phosphinothricin acetyltransferase
MAQATIRAGTRADLPALTRIYNHYVAQSPATFDTEPFTERTRLPWISQFADSGPHRLFVAERDGQLLGYAESHGFRARAAYARSVESSVYLEPGAVGRGLGRELYAVLLPALHRAGVHRVVAGITLPNDASLALHRRAGFEDCGVMSEVGFKHGRYWDVQWMLLRLGDDGDAPSP